MMQINLHNSGIIWHSIHLIKVFARFLKYSRAKLAVLQWNISENIGTFMPLEQAFTPEGFVRAEIVHHNMQFEFPRELRIQALENHCQIRFWSGGGGQVW